MGRKKYISRPTTKPAQPGRLQVMQVVLVCAAVFLAPLIAGKLLPVPSLIIQLLVFIAGGIWLYESARNGRIELPGRMALYPLAALVVLMGVSVICSVNKGLSIREFLTTGSYLLLFLIVASHRGNKATGMLIVASLCLSTLAVCVIGLREYIATASAGWRTFSTFFNPDFLAGFTAMALPVALAWYLSSTDTKVSIIAGFTAALTFANLLLTGSRLGFIASAVGIMIFAILTLISKSIRRPQVIKLAILAVPTLLVFYLLSTPLTARAGSVAAVKAESHSGNFRILTWKGAVKMAMSNPAIGTGVGTFEEAYSRYAIVGFTKLAHNSYIQIAGEAGFPALGALLSLLGAVILPGTWRIIRSKAGHPTGDQPPPGLRWMPESRLIACGVIAGLMASIARNAVDSDWYITSIGISFWALAGVALGIAGEGSVIRLTARSMRVIAIVPALMALSVLMLLMGELWHQSAVSRAMAGNPQEGDQCYRNAQRFDPLNADYHRRRGMLLSMGYPGMDGSANLKSSIEEYETAIRLAPSSARGYYQLAKVYAGMGEGAAAIDMYGKSLECDPNSPQTLLALARQYELMGRRPDALSVYRRMSKIEESPYETVRAVPEIVEPAYIFAHEALGKDSESRGDMANALREYRRAMVRIVAYQLSMKGMGEILEAGGSRNLNMESDVESARLEILQRMVVPSRS